MEKEKEEIIELILQLIERKGALFIMHLARRLQINYNYFVVTEGFGDVKNLEDLFLLAVDYVKTNNVLVSPDLIEESKNIVLDLAPHSEDYPSVFSTFALDACACCYDMFSYLLENESDSIISASEMSINTVLIYKMEELSSKYPEDELEMRAYESAEVQKELLYQKTLLKRIIAENDIDKLITDTLNKKYESNIGLIVP